MTRLIRTGADFFRRVVPWLVAVGILGLLIRRAGPTALGAALHEANLGFLVGVTVICTVAMLGLDALALSWAVSRFNVRVGAGSMARVKAAAYLLNVLNYNAGSGAIALWLARRKRIPFLEAMSSLLIVNVVDVLVLVGFMAAGGGALAPSLRAGVLTIVCATALAFSGALLYWRAGIDFLVLGRLRGWPIFKSFRLATVVDYAWLGAVRVPFACVFFLNLWAGLHAFGIRVPLLEVTACVPVIAFIGAVPITVAGLGTVQAATVFLFRHRASEAELLAFSLTLTVVLSGVRAAFGVPFFATIWRDIVHRDESGPSSPQSS